MSSFVRYSTLIPSRHDGGSCKSEDCGDLALHQRSRTYRLNRGMRQSDFREYDSFNESTPRGFAGAFHLQRAAPTLGKWRLSKDDRGCILSRQQFQRKLPIDKLTLPEKTLIGGVSNDEETDCRQGLPETTREWKQALEHSHSLKVSDREYMVVATHHLEEAQVVAAAHLSSSGAMNFHQLQGYAGRLLQRI